MLEIDGSYGEGGGAILRVATGLSIVLGKPIKVFNIRKGRKQPGLKTQHMLGLRAAAELCSGTLKGAEIGSTGIEFQPGTEFAEKIKVNIPTAGSVGLVLQVLQLGAVFAPKPVKIEIRGGASYGKWAANLDYLKNVTYKVLEKMGYKIDLQIETEGFYPEGGCKATATFHPCKELKPLDLTSLGEIEKVEGISVASKTLEKAKVAERQKIAARQKIFKELKVSAKIQAQYSDPISTGSGICLWLETSQNCILGSDFIGERGIRAETVGENAAKELAAEFKAGNCVDRYLADQLIPFMALTNQPCKFRHDGISEHTKTNIWVCEQFLGKKFETTENLTLTRQN